jgi:hypothetical protein
MSDRNEGLAATSAYESTGADRVVLHHGRHEGQEFGDLRKLKANMSSIIVGPIIFACLFGGAMLATGLRAVLPAHHLGSDSKEASAPLRTALAQLGS